MSNGWVAANKVASSWSIYNGMGPYTLTWMAVLDPTIMVHSSKCNKKRFEGAYH
jgi:hypothetical protein